MNMEKQAKKFMKSAKANWSKAKRTYVCRSLKDLIKAYRACTTRSEERALVKKEAAHIRDLFREGDKAFRRQNIAKLLFFHMNGYPTDFGMTECIKLCASPKYNDKRIAYLGLMILVDETAEVLMLMTHCLQQDLTSDEVQIVSLALNVLGDISSVEMVRDLLPDIERHMLSPNPFIRKKATLAAVRAVRKLTPEETSDILRHAPSVFDMRSSAVHISGSTLINALCEQSRDNLPHLQSTVTPIILGIIRENLLSKRGQGVEPVIGGVRNPFLQVKLISTIRVLLEEGGSPNLIESASDIMAQVAANTDGSKTAGCAVLYECVRTIMAIPVDSDLRALCVKILGKFLSHKEPTVRYIALQELTKLVDTDGNRSLRSVDGYKAKVLAALHEADPTIRKRAVELVYRIADSQNVAEIMKELLTYIEKSNTAEDKKDACWKIFALLDRFGPSDSWKVETFIQALSYADTSMPEELISSFLALISSNPSIHGLAVLKLFNEARVAASPEATTASDPFSSQQLTISNSTTQGNDEASKTMVRKPRLQRVALYVLGEHGEAAADVGLEISRILDAFEHTLKVSETVDEPWMNTFDEAYWEENKILGEVALTGLVKFAQRAINGSSGMSQTSNPMLSITAGQGSSADPLSGLLSIKAPPPQKPPAMDGFGADLLSSLGLGDESAGNGNQHNQSRALVPAFNALTVQDPGTSDLLMSVQDDGIGNSGNPVIERVRRILLLRARDHELETQQRACEYLMLLNESLLPLLTTTMHPMPPLDLKKMQERVKHRRETRSVKHVSKANVAGEGSLFDLLGDNSTPTEAPLALPSSGEDLLALPGPSVPTNETNLTLEDIMMGGNRTSTQGSSGITAGSGMPLDMLPVSSLQDTSHEDAGLGTAPVLEKNIINGPSIQVDATFFKDNLESEMETRAELVFTNKSSSVMTNFVFLLAVPKYIKLHMHPASATEIDAGGQATQRVELINTLYGQRPIQFRYRVEYSDQASGELVQEQGVATGLESL